MAFTPNPLGYVSPTDGGNARIITAKAIETISGGEPVFFSGAAAAVGSRIDSLADGDILATRVPIALGSKFNGVAIDTVTSGNRIGVATRGTVIMYCDGTVTGGHLVAIGSNSCVRDYGTGSDTAANLTAVFTAGPAGRAFTNAGSEQFALIDLNP